MVLRTQASVRAVLLSSDTNVASELVPLAPKPYDAPPVEVVPYKIDETEASKAFCQWAVTHGAAALNVEESIRQRRLVTSDGGPGAGFSLQRITLPFWSFTTQAIVTDHDAAKLHRDEQRRRAQAASRNARDNFEAEAASRAARASQEDEDTSSPRIVQGLLYVGHRLPRAATEVAKVAIRKEPYPHSSTPSDEETFVLPELAAAWAVAREQIIPTIGPGRELRLKRARRLMIPAYEARYRWGGIPFATEGMAAGHEYRAIVSGVSGEVDGVNHTPPWESIGKQAIATGKQAAKMIEQSNIRVNSKGFNNFDVKMMEMAFSAVRAGSSGLMRAGARLGPFGIAAMIVAPFVVQRMLPAAKQAWTNFEWQTVRDAEVESWRTKERGWRVEDYMGPGGEWEMLGLDGSASAESKSADAYDEARTVNWIDPYSVLGLDKNDTLSRAELQVALRKELLRWHPDHNASDSQFASERTKRILAAYHTLRQSAT
ncbi:DnaJ protein [Pseudoscourfieldia marina]